MNRMMLAVVAVLLSLGAADSHEPIVGLPCEGCELVFEGLPESPVSAARIAPPSEPGQPLLIQGTVRDANGRPASGVIVYAYHTDARGIYPSAATRHGRLRGWASTDAEGRYSFATIRPAGYPDTDIPQHVHMHVIERGRCTYFIDELLFDDDPRLTPDHRRQLSPGRGGSGVVTPKRRETGGWVVTRDIVLGAGVPGYPGNENK